MAAALRRYSRPVFNIILQQKRLLHVSKTKTSAPKIATLCGCAIGATFSVYMLYRNRSIRLNASVLAKERDEVQVKAAVQTQRELRFLSFASIEFEGNVYMTPQDFLESVTEEIPRPRIGRTRLNKDEVDKYLKVTPARGKGTTHLFRKLHDHGVISYTEYLFLLCVLTKPQSGFRIAFNMFDTDGNQRVDKREFLVLVTLFRKTFARLKLSATAVQPPIFKNIWDLVASYAGDSGSDTTPVQDTSLTIHFFGRKGTEVLMFEDFDRFMSNLQTEVMELEFSEFSRGMPTITEEEFAKILLHYTILSKEEHAEYLQRLKQRIPHAKGISFQDFKEFGQFMNNLDDFSIAMRMYTLADQPISEDEFKRAVKVCTGQNLNAHLVHTVFQLFDADGDGHLSHKEFLSVMKDRLHRGFKAGLPHQNTWETFKTCVKGEMRKA